jgi:hypothetical protein
MFAYWMEKKVANEKEKKDLKIEIENLAYLF